MSNPNKKRRHENDAEQQASSMSRQPHRTASPRLATTAPSRSGTAPSVSESTSHPFMVTAEVVTREQEAFAKRLEAAYVGMCVHANEQIKRQILSRDVTPTTEPTFVFRPFVDEYFRILHLADRRFGRETGWMMGCGFNDMRSLGMVLTDMPNQERTRRLSFLNLDLRNKRIRQICAGALFGVALSIYGVPYTWGPSDEGSVGRITDRTMHSDDDKAEWEATPAPVVGLPPITQVAAGNCHCLFLTEDGKVYMSGTFCDGDSGRYRNPEEPTSSIEGVNAIPVLVLFPQRVIQIFTGQSANFDYALLEDGTLYSWGFGNMGELARTKYMGLPLKNNHYHAGRDTYTYEEGDKPQTNRKEALKFLIPAPVPLPSKQVLSVACGAAHVLVVARNEKGHGVIYASGLNNYGQLGNGRATTQSHHADNPELEVTQHELRPIKALAHENMSKVAAGEFHCLALTLDGAHLYAWGRGDKGQLGIGQEITKNWKIDFVATPTLVVFHNRTTRCILKAIQCGGSHSLALSYEGDVYSWGYTDGNAVMATGQRARRGLDVYVPTKLDMRVGNHTMEAIKMAGGSNTSLFLVQEPADEDDVVV